MNRTKHSILTLAVFVTGALASAIAMATEVPVTLSGASEVPPVQTAAGGRGKIVVGDDGAVSGGITTTGIAGTIAHIHMGATGKNGPPIVSLFVGPGAAMAGCAMANTGQLAEMIADPANFYVSVATTDFPDGALRGQLSG